MISFSIGDSALSEYWSKSNKFFSSVHCHTHEITDHTCSKSLTSLLEVSSVLPLRPVSFLNSFLLPSGPCPTHPKLKHSNSGMINTESTQSTPSFFFLQTIQKRFLQKKNIVDVPRYTSSKARDHWMLLCCHPRKVNWQHAAFRTTF